MYSKVKNQYDIENNQALKDYRHMSNFLHTKQSKSPEKKAQDAQLIAELNDEGID